MNRQEKEEKKQIIREKINLGNGWYRDDEIDKLLDMVNNPEKYNGITKTTSHSGIGINAKGRYSWNDKTTYSITDDESGVKMNTEYEYHDNENYRHNDSVTKNGRDILNVFKEIFQEF